MTEETQPEVSPPTDSQSSTPDTVNKAKDNKKDKCRPMTKVVIRRLPPSMTQEQFVEQISPLPDHDYMYFVKADMSLGQFAFSRAYINFVDQQDIFIFREKFDNYVFVDAKGTEYPAVVEFAPFQRLPKKRVGKKKDQKCGTLKTDPYYLSFLESLKNQEAESGLSQPKTEYSYQPSDGSSKKVTTTPLLEFLKQRKQEKQRLRDEKREERRRRDLERRRAKDELTISKVLKNPDLGKDTNKESKEAKDDKDKVLPKEGKSRNRKEEKLRDKTARDRDSKVPGKNFKDKEAKHQRRNEEKKGYVRKEEREISKEDKKTDGKEERKNETREDDREIKDKKVEEKRGKSYEKMRQEKKRLAEAKRQSVEFGSEPVNTGKVKKEERESFSKRDRRSEGNVAGSRAERIQILKDDVKKKDEKTKIKPEPEPESIDFNEELSETCDNNIQSELHDNDVGGSVSPDDNLVESGKSKSSDHIDSESNYATDLSMKGETKLMKRRNSLESGGEGGGGDGATLRRHKSLDGGERCGFKKDRNHDKEKSKKDPRQERRIRNKDRPAMEIYRPGMGRFSKQRLEREKSNNDERASLSQSPTPSPVPSVVGKPSKPAASELRSMTFKRSLSRDLP
ncbi:regulator of nonsense transcripts 3B [Athalia rosae]|uniref:regulator of nonsense transcripts 3B n=1 Tax=Athalia rosae TaxID=37344 RepID=UPI00203459AD|nr:regulator of nonsense transcripts 3B [Athalia rosae]XP_020710081.2 regulator of nonsense transcripts 3B [Athalia rosae]XP_020710083.2 regulator of nonsense transcripts 3B [Athalia rosae]